jgi:hypothetical protein
MTAALIATALLHLGLGSEMALGHEASVRTEARIQQALPGTGATITNEAVEVQPGLTLTAADRVTTVAATYSPRFTHLAGDSGRRDTWLQFGSLAATWRPSAAWNARAAGQATHGTADLFRFLSIQAPGSEAPPIVQAAPLVTSIAYQKYELTAGADGRLAPRLLLRANLGATREGGFGAAALKELPLQQVERLTADLDWRVSRTDTLGGALAATLAHYFDMPLSATALPGGGAVASWSVWSGRLAGTWRHALARDTTFQLSGGLALVGGDRPGQARQQLLPTADVGLTTEPRLRDLRLQGGVSLELAPQEDRLSGTMVERSDLRAWIGWVPTERWSIRGAISGGVVVSGQSRRDKLGTSDLRLGWAAADFLDFALGLRGSLQEQPRLATPRYVEWSAYLAVAVAHRRQAERIKAPTNADPPAARP